MLSCKEIPKVFLVTNKIMESASNASEAYIRTKLALPLLAVLVLLIAAFYIGSTRNPEQAPNEPTILKLSDIRKENDLIYAPDETGPFTGVVVEYYEDGTLKSQTEVSEGKLQGLSEGWHENGQLQVKESFEQGVAHGLRQKWRPDGSKESEGTIQNGQFEGTFRKWHPNGQLAEEMQMTQGVAHGEAKSWHENGSLKATVTLDHGKVIKQEFFEENAAR